MPNSDSEQRLERIYEQLEALWATWDKAADPDGSSIIDAEVDLLNPLSLDELHRLFPEDESCRPMTVLELAEYFNVCRQTIYRWAREDGFPTPEPGPRWAPYWILVWKNHYRVSVPDRRWRGDRMRY